MLVLVDALGHPFEPARLEELCRRLGVDGEVAERRGVVRTFAQRRLGEVVVVRGAQKENALAFCGSDRCHGLLPVLEGPETTNGRGSRRGAILSLSTLASERKMIEEIRKYECTQEHQQKNSNDSRLAHIPALVGVCRRWPGVGVASVPRRPCSARRPTPTVFVYVEHTVR